MKSTSMNLPDLLPNTFRLAEQSSLFSNLDQSPTNANYSIVMPQISQITLEKVQFFEPEHAETVHIVDLSEDNASDTSDSGSSPKKERFRAKPSAEAEKERINTERINSFYESDKECHEEPLVFSEDEDGSLDNGFGANLVH